MNEISLTVRGVAHDLNNQLMILLNTLDRLTILSPEDLDARLAMKAAEQCAVLASQLLPQTRERRATPSVSIRELVSEAAMLIRPLLPVHNRLDIECHADGHVAAFPSEIQQALVNLCLNAIDAMDGPGIIRISARLEESRLNLSVFDNGPGIPAALRDLIFEPEFTTKAARGGNGLGLARVRQAVERFGGSISVHDVFPRGACFRIHLPLIPALTDRAPTDRVLTQ